MASPTRILLTGATGYIGGTVLAHLLGSSSPTLAAATIACLVRRDEHAARISSLYGSRVHPVVFSGLDDAAAITAAASQSDLVINSAVTQHAGAAHALLRGLAQRRAETGRDVWLIHTSGTSNLGDRPVSRRWRHSPPGREFDDAADDTYAVEEGLEARENYAQRAAELSTIDAGLALGVRTLVIMPPTIFGQGTGPFNTLSIQIPAYVRAALKAGRAVVLGDGHAVWSHVHVLDLAALYELVVLDALDNAGASLPRGKQAILFSDALRRSWMDTAQAVAAALVEQGKLPDGKVETVDLAAAVAIFGVDEMVAELGFGSDSRTVGTVARRQLGWKPTRGDDAWLDAIRQDVRAILAREPTAAAS